jgi:hypothetical protein
MTDHDIMSPTRRHVHASAIVPADQNFTTLLDSWSAEGWDVLHLSVVGQAVPASGVFDANGKMVAGQPVPVAFVVLRRSADVARKPGTHLRLDEWPAPKETDS